MTPETHKKLQQMVDQIWEYLCGATGSENYEAGIAALRENIRKTPSLAVLSHEVPRRTYPMIQLDSIRPENFYDILGLIDNKEKAQTVLRELPEDAAPEIEKALRWMLKEWLPSLRSNAQSMAKHLPQRRGGGAPSKMPNEAECREICAKINKLYGEGTPLGKAQQRAAMEKGKSLRMVQRIWAQRGKFAPTDLRSKRSISK